VPLPAILDRPQHTPQQAPLMVSVKRLAWDPLSVDLGESASDGIVAPGSTFPVLVGYNIISPESGEVAVRTTAAIRPLRGGDDLSNYDSQQRDMLPANRREPPVRSFGVTAPRAEGTYVLEVRASWEPTANREGTRLGRLIRRYRSSPVSSSATRRVVFTVIDPAANVLAAGHDERVGEIEVDAIDLTRSRSYRPLAAGRSPAAESGRSAWAVPPQALIEPSRRDRLRGWIMRTGLEAAKLDPANASGLAWTAVGLKVAHPDRPHRLTLKVKGGEPGALGVALIEPGNADAGSPSRLVLDACASGPPILQDGPPAAFSWLVWPSAAEVVLLLLNRSTDGEVRLGSVTLTELDEQSAGPSASQPPVAAGRALGLYLGGVRALEPFSANSGTVEALTTARHLARYMAYCGASAVVLPEKLADRSSRRALACQAEEDSTGPDRLEIVRRVLSRQGFSVWLELDFEGPGVLPGLPPADSPEAAKRGLVRVDRQGRPDGAVYHALNPEVREAMKRRVVEALQQNQRGSRDPSGSMGLMIRLGPGPTLLGTPDTGIDDATFDRFVRESFSAETARGIPGSGDADPERFTVRSRYLAGVGRMPWLKWRSRAMASLYAELADTAHATAPGAMIAVVTPGLDDGPAGIEARRVDRAGLAPSQAWRSVGLDLQAWPSSAGTQPVFRGVALSTDALAHDLATSPDLDSLVAGRGQRGLLLTVADDPSGVARRGGMYTPSEDRPDESLSYAPNSSIEGRSQTGPTARSAGRPPGNDQDLWLTALPLGDGPSADEMLGHALAALDARWVFLAGKAAAGQEERLRRFSVILRALPALPAVPIAQADLESKPFGVAVRRVFDDSQTYLQIANDSPYPIRLAGLLDAPGSAPIEDLGRGLRLSPTLQAGGRNLVLDLRPHGIAAIRIGAPRAGLTSVTPYPSDAVLTTMQARFNELSAQLARLNHGVAPTSAEPANPGFEPDPDPVLPPELQSTGKASNAAAGTSAATIPGGWSVRANGESPATIAVDNNNPHRGRGSLRLTAPVAPASVVSETFAPDAQSSLDIQVYFRASAAGSKVGVWIEGESGGQPYIRRTELDVSIDWEGRVVRALDIPSSGLEKARLRFELMTPGTLWIDDLQVQVPTASRSTRLNTQITLLAALQAYREKRFADFARLAGSHWIRQATESAVSRLARANDLWPKAGPRANRTTDASASALPPERKLR
jgi:hypothetical protein